MVFETLELTIVQSSWFKGLVFYPEWLRSIFQVNMAWYKHFNIFVELIHLEKRFWCDAAGGGATLPWMWFWGSPRGQSSRTVRLKTVCRTFILEFSLVSMFLAPPSGLRLLLDRSYSTGGERIMLKADNNNKGVKLMLFCAVEKRTEHEGNVRLSGFKKENLT